MYNALYIINDVLYNIYYILYLCEAMPSVSGDVSAKVHKDRLVLIKFFSIKKNVIYARIIT
jgi:hypothetical protein